MRALAERQAWRLYEERERPKPPSNAPLGRQTRKCTVRFDGSSSIHRHAQAGRQPSLNLRLPAVSGWTRATDNFLIAKFEKVESGSSD